MANITTTDIDTGSLVLRDDEHSDGLLTLAGADVIAEGTILARDSSTLKYVLFVIGGVTNENGIPKAIMPYEVESTGAGDVAIRALVSGEVNAARLIVDADGDASNVTALELDQLRDFGILALNVDQLGVHDNPNNP